MKEKLGSPREKFGGLSRNERHMIHMIHKMILEEMSGNTVKSLYEDLVRGPTCKRRAAEKLAIAVEVDELSIREALASLTEEDFGV